MSIAESVIQEFMHESTTTRKLLQRLPDNLSWQPHQKSMSLGRLATHVAELPHWASLIAGQDEFEMGATDHKPSALDSRRAILEAFERNLAGFSEVLQGKSDEDLTRTWTFRSGGQVIVQLPRVAALRSFVLNHLVHHRGQLSVYLRLNNVPLPGIYGPSADER